jgi:tetratricopeptide (TPR) repeat protein
MHHKYLVFCLIIFILTPWRSYPQEKLGLPVVAVVTSEAGPAVNAVATIFEDGKQIQALGIGNGGRINLTFSFNHEYILVLSGDNCFPKRIAISTPIPRRVFETNHKFPPFVIEQSLFSEIKGIDKSFSDNTILRIYYDPTIDNFISEVYYNDAQIKKLIENAVWRSQQVGKTADQLSKLTAEELRLMRQEYNQWIKEAGDNYASAKYQDALMGYKAANRLFPDEQFPKDRIAEINDLLLALQITDNLSQVQETKFKTLISQAGQQFDLKIYEDSKGLYRQALSIKANDPVAIARIAEIDQILKQKMAEEEYKNVIAEADRLFKIGNLDPSKQQYNQALNKRPGESYPKQQIKEIEKLKDAQDKEATHLLRYSTALTEGDSFRDKKQYLRARESYDFALSFKPGDSIASARIATIDQILNQEQDNKEYNSLIADGDKAYNQKNFNEALTAYQSAQKIKPAEDYPQHQIRAVQSVLENERQKTLAEENYHAKIKEGDTSFASAEYDKARGSYSEALKLKPGEKYPTDRIAEINKIQSTLASQKQTDEQYKAKIARADQDFTAKNYQDSKLGYTEALKIKPGEVYPKQKIAEINGILDKEALTRKEFDNAIAQADRLYQNKNIAEARQAYQNAKKIIPAEKYPDEMIAKIDSTLSEQARLAAEKQAADEAKSLAYQREQDQKYNSLIQQADAQKSEKKYKEAIASYQSALQVKPKETYPPQQIAEIKNLLDKEATAQKDYDNILTEADRLYRNKSMDEAKLAYAKAQSIKPTETYPGEMITKIDAFIAEQNRLAAAQKVADEAKKLAARQELDEKYNSLVRQADKQKSEKQYADAITSYKSALGLKPQETYPSQQIAEVNELIRQTDALDKKYRETVAVADKAFQAKRYPDAKNSYQSVLGLKPGDAYAQSQLDKIVEIEAQAASAQQMENLYKQRIAHADELMKAEDFTKAIAEYQMALELKPGESYPKTKIAEANGKLTNLEQLKKDREALDKKYAEAVAAADAAFNGTDYDKAEAGYRQALNLKSNESYPADRLNQIKQIREEAIRDRFNEIVADADKLLTDKNYTASKARFGDALKIIPGDDYAKKRVAEIDNLMEAQAKAERDLADLNKRYLQAVSLGDRSFELGSYDAAVDAYNQALGYKPGETYPTQKIAEITKIVEARKADAEYKRLLVAADGFFRLKQYPEARQGYSDALAVKTTEKYPADQIKVIDGLLAKAKQQQESETVVFKVQTATPEAANSEATKKTVVNEDAGIADLYNGFIKNGDQAFGDKEYNFARYYYLKALDIQPGLAYPKQKLSEIKTIIDSRLNDANEKAYQENIDKADTALKQGEFAVARAYYNRAVAAKPAEKYPKGQLDLIKRKVDEITGNTHATEFKSLISQGDSAFQVKDYVRARYYYFKAADLNPSESYPNQQIGQINQILGGN